MPNSVSQSHKIYVVSPHQDDAAFSLALIIAKLLHCGCQVSIINCFTRTNYSPYAGFESLELASQRRHQEDVLFAESAGGAEIIDLGLSDSPLRFGISSQDVRVSRSGQHVYTFDSAAAKLKQSFVELPPAVLTLIPLAIGGHLDHLAARDAALSLPLLSILRV